MTKTEMVTRPVKSWIWDHLGSERRGRLILGEHLCRVMVEIAGSAVVVGLQMAGHAVADRLTRRDSPTAD